MVLKWNHVVAAEVWDSAGTFDKSSSKTNKEMFADMLHAWKRQEIINELLLHNHKNGRDEKVLLGSYETDKMIIKNQENDKSMICFDSSIFSKIESIPEIEQVGSNNIHWGVADEDRGLTDQISKNLNAAIKRKFEEKKEIDKNYKMSDLLQELGNRFKINPRSIQAAMVVKERKKDKDRKRISSLSAENIVILEKEFGIHRDEILGEIVNRKELSTVTGLNNLFDFYLSDPEHRRMLNKVLNILAKKLSSTDSGARRTSILETVEAVLKK